ncbi:MAG TPA: FAD-dependent oxidoreductase [Kofleriaceae bacterium]|nr:FAD-dependent oxidoreductase [Kofleriaceae bacterium]
MRALVIGSGIFGVTAALELAARGCAVTLTDPGPLPHPLAESTDISKVVRSDYGADLDYTVLGEQSIEGFRRWNAAWSVPRFHETGAAFLARAPMAPGGFEYESFAMLSRRGHRVERLDAAEIVRRFPAYRPGALVDGYLHHEAGWAESGAIVAELVAQCRARGVTVREGCSIDRLGDEPARAAFASGGTSRAAESLAADVVVVAAGSWTPRLVPALASSLRAVGQPVFQLRPADPSLFAAARFPVFGADLSRTGYYGFPVTPGGIVKIANHGTGIAMAEGTPRQTTPAQERALREMLRETFPSLADAPLAESRLCVYGDSHDSHFWIARDPDRPHVTVAAGGSGHAFKFAPMLGPLIADIALGVPHPLAHKFRWRPDLGAAPGGDAARAT